MVAGTEVAEAWEAERSSARARAAVQWLCCLGDRWVAAGRWEGLRQVESHRRAAEGSWLQRRALGVTRSRLWLWSGVRFRQVAGLVAGVEPGRLEPLRRLVEARWGRWARPRRIAPIRLVRRGSLS